MIESANHTHKKTRIIHIRISPIELEIISLAAQRARLTIAEYVRKTVLERANEEGK